MTTTDAAKRNRDARDAAWMLAALNGTGEPRTRTHAINPDTGEFTRLDQESDTMTDHRAEADKALDGDAGWGPLAHLMAAIHDTLKDIAGNSAEQYAMLAEIRDRLPEHVKPTLDWLDDPVPVPRPEPADITEERPDACCGKCPPINGGGYDCTCVGNPRCEKADTPEEWHVDPAPADVDPEPKAELDEVEALAMDLYHASLLIPPVKEIGPTAWLSERDHEMWLGVARAARERIEAEADDADFSAASLHYARAERAEADLARMTKARDRHSRAADKWCNLYADKCEEIESVQTKADRYDALRADVVSLRDGWRRQGSGWTKSITAVAADQVDGILTRDDERAES